MKQKEINQKKFYSLSLLGALLVTGLICAFTISSSLETVKESNRIVEETPFELHTVNILASDSTKVLFELDGLAKSLPLANVAIEYDTTIEQPKLIIKKYEENSIGLGISAEKLILHPDEPLN